MSKHDDAVLAFARLREAYEEAADALVDLVAAGEPGDDYSPFLEEIDLPLELVAVVARRARCPLTEE